MLYMICATDVANSLDKRLAARPAHLERLNALKAEGRLIMAGPFPAVDSPDPGPAGFTGSLVVAEFDSLEDAQSWADADPYIKAGVYASVIVKPYKKVLP
ncbi:MAG: YciI family protein [Pseudomonadota bacterium]